MRGFCLAKGAAAPSLEYKTETGLLRARLLLAHRPVLPEAVPPHGGPLIWPLQVHGTTFLDGSSAPRYPSRPEADGIFLSAAGAVGQLRFADCFPLLITGKGPCRWVFGLHCGFKGTVLGIVDEAFSFLARRGIGVDDVEAAWIGPGIGPCCFDRRLEDPWTQRGLSLFDAETASVESDVARFDIGGYLLRRLLVEGLDENQVFYAASCTACNRDLFYSFRGGDREARMSLLFHL